MYTSTFEYFRPTSVAEAVELLGKNKDAKILAGGHSLLPAMKLRTASPKALVDIGRVPGLAGIAVSGSTLTIGALATHDSVATSDVVRANCALLAETAAHIGDQQVRNRGTIGGSLAHADPAADYPTAIVALDATLTVIGPQGQRELKAAQFFVDLFTTALQAGEIITAINVPTYGRGTGGAYMKHRHPASYYAVVGVAALVTLDGDTVSKVSIAVGGATVNPVRAAAAEGALAGKAATADNIASAAAKVAEALQNPLGDLYASGEYRTHLATVLAKRALLKAVERARG